MISVIMPVYNGEEYLCEAIESILHQTYSNFELIILNDGSTDRTEEIILSYDDPRIVYVKNSENLRIVKTLNKGISLAKGEYIARMDADDVSMPERFEKQIAFLETHQEVDVVGSARKLCSNHKEMIFPLQHKQMMVRLLFTSPLLHPAVMARKAFYQRYQYDDAYDKAEDYHLWVHAVNDATYANLKEPLLCYRYHLGQTHSMAFEQQIATAKRVRNYYLEQLQIVLNEEQKEDLYQLSRTRYVPLERAERLYKILQEPPRFDQDFLKKDFSGYVYRMVRSDGIRHGLRWKDYKDSIFYTLYQPSLAERLKYYIRYVQHILGRW